MTLHEGNRNLNRRDDPQRTFGAARSDSWPEFAAVHLRKWLAAARTRTLRGKLGSPWGNGHCELSDPTLREEFLNSEIFFSIKELRVLAARWHVHFNALRTHSSRGYRPTVPETWFVDH